LIEFFQVITDTKKIPNPLSTQNAQKIIREIISDPRIQFLSTTFQIITDAFNTADQFHITKYGIYDHIIATNLRINKISEFYTKNTTDFLKYDFLHITDPFK
jgi:predicted nucleic acid-binding protein